MLKIEVWQGEIYYIMNFALNFSTQLSIIPSEGNLKSPALETFKVGSRVLDEWNQKIPSELS